MSFAESYLGQLRALVGSRPLLVVGVRALIEDDDGRILILKRTDTGDWGLPAGSMELGESVSDALHREVMEETNLSLADIEVFGISSNPEIETYTYPNGHCVQCVVVLAKAKIDRGQIGSNDGEASAFRFVDPVTIDKATFAPPEFPTIGYFLAFRDTGKFQFA